MQLSLDSKRLDLTFAACLLALIVVPVIFPFLRLMFFSPFLIIAIYNRELKTCLWLALLSGVCLDLLSANGRFGLHSLAFCATLILLYPQRRNFFADSVSTLPLMTFFFSFISTLIMAVIYYVIQMQNIFSWEWMFADVLVMPLADSCYAFICFILPALLLGKRQRRGTEYFHS